MTAIDIRCETYDECLRGYLVEAEGRVDFALEPHEAISAYSHEGAETRGEPVKTANYPPGTWFYYTPDRVYVRRGNEDSFCRIEAR